MADMRRRLDLDATGFVRGVNSAVEAMEQLASISDTLYSGLDRWSKSADKPASAYLQKMAGAEGTLRTVTNMLKGMTQQQERVIELAPLMGQELKSALFQLGMTTNEYNSIIRQGQKAATQLRTAVSFNERSLARQQDRLANLRGVSGKGRGATDAAITELAQLSGSRTKTQEGRAELYAMRARLERQMAEAEKLAGEITGPDDASEEGKKRARRLQSINRRIQANTEKVAAKEEEILRLTTARVEAERRSLAAAEADAFHRGRVEHLSPVEQAKIRKDTTEAIYRGSAAAGVAPKDYMSGLAGGKYIDASSTMTDRMIRRQQEVARQEELRQKKADAAKQEEAAKAKSAADKEAFEAKQAETRAEQLRRRAAAGAEADRFYGNRLKGMSTPEAKKLRDDMAEAIAEGAAKANMAPADYMSSLGRGENLDANTYATKQYISREQQRAKAAAEAQRARRLQEVRAQDLYGSEIGNISDPEKQLAAIGAVRKLEEAYAASNMTLKEFVENLAKIRASERDIIKQHPEMAAAFQALRRAAHVPGDPNQKREQYTAEVRARTDEFAKRDEAGKLLSGEAAGIRDQEHVLRLNAAREKVYHAFATARRRKTGADGSPIEEALGFDEYPEMLRKIRSGNVALGREFEGITRAVMQFDSAMGAARHSAGRWMEDWNNWSRLVSARVLTFGFYNLISLMRQSGQEAITVSRGIGEILSITQSMPQTNKDWERSIYEIANAYNFTLADTVEGLYQAISNQVAAGSDILTFMQSSAQFAKTTKSSIVQSVDLLSAAVNAFGYDASSTEHIAAVLFRTIELGRVRTEDMANTFGRVAATAALAGVTFEDLGAAIAQITVRGVKYERASTFIINVLNKMMKPSKQMQQIFADMGVTSGEALIKIHGLTGVIKLLADRVGYSASEVAEMFKDIRAVGGISLLTQDAKKLQEVAEQLQKSSEYYNKAKTKIAETSGERMAKDLNKVRTAFIGISQAAIEASYRMTDALSITTKGTGTGLGAGIFAAAGAGSSLLAARLLRKRFPLGLAQGARSLFEGMDARAIGKGALIKGGIAAAGAGLFTYGASKTGMFGNDPYVAEQRENLKRIATILGVTHETELKALQERVSLQTQDNQTKLLGYRTAAMEEKRLQDREFAARKRYYDTILSYFNGMAANAERLMRTEQDALVATAINPVEKNNAQYQAIMARMALAERDPSKAADYQQKGVSELVDLYASVTQNIGELTRQQREALDWSSKSPMEMQQKQQAWMEWANRSNEDRMINWAQRPDLQEEWQFGRNAQLIGAQQQQAGYLRDELRRLGLGDDLLAEKMNYESQARTWDEYFAEFSDLHKYITEKMLDEDFVRLMKDGVTIPLLEQLRGTVGQDRGKYGQEVFDAYSKGSSWDRLAKLSEELTTGRRDVRANQEEADAARTRLDTGQADVQAYGVGLTEAQRVQDLGYGSPATRKAIDAQISAMNTYAGTVTETSMRDGSFQLETLKHQTKLMGLFNQMLVETMKNTDEAEKLRQAILAANIGPYRKPGVLPEVLPLPGAMAKGGPVGTDTVPAWLTPGEFVVNKKATEAYRPFLESINRYADGGWVERKKRGKSYWYNENTGAFSSYNPQGSRPMPWVGHELKARTDYRYLPTGRDQVSSFSNRPTVQDRATDQEFDRRKAIRDRKRMESQVLSDIVQGFRGKPDVAGAQARKRADLQAQMLQLQQEGGRLKQTADARSAIYNQAAWGLGGAAMGAGALFAAPAIAAGLGSMGFGGASLTALGIPGIESLPHAGAAVRALYSSQKARKWGRGVVSPLKYLAAMEGYEWLRQYVTRGPVQGAPGMAKGGLVNNYTINAPITLNGSGATALDVRNMVSSLNREIARGSVRVRQ
jgi:TP901 family phage tail tape measure protein